MLRRLLFGSAMLLGLTACGGFEDDMATICNAPKEVNLEGVDDPSQRAAMLAKHISERIRTDEAKSLFSSLSTVAPGQRKAKLEKAAKSAGIEECPFLETYGPTPDSK